MKGSDRKRGGMIGWSFGVWVKNLRSETENFGVSPRIAKLSDGAREFGM